MKIASLVLNLSSQDSILAQEVNEVHMLVSGSCHLDRASNVEIGVEYQIFVIDIFFNFQLRRDLKFGAHSRY